MSPCKNAFYLDIASCIFPSHPSTEPGHSVLMRTLISCLPLSTVNSTFVFTPVIVSFACVIFQGLLS